VKKLGDSVIREMVPCLEKGLESSDENLREGAMLGLSEMIHAATKEQVEENAAKLVPAVREGLCDDSAMVRRSAATAFQSLYRTLGSSTGEVVLPALLAELDADCNERTLSGLRELVRGPPFNGRCVMGPLRDR
jgi:vesicle coat complex subunit